MSESGVGVSVACTRQNARRSVNVAPRPPGRPPRAGATNDPAATVCAIVIVVFGSVSADRLSHVAAKAPDETRANANVAVSTSVLGVMGRNITGSGSGFRVQGSTGNLIRFR